MWGIPTIPAPTPPPPLAPAPSPSARSLMIFVSWGWTLTPCQASPPLALWGPAPTHSQWLDKLGRILQQSAAPTQDTTVREFDMILLNILTVIYIQCMLSLEPPPLTRWRSPTPTPAQPRPRHSTSWPGRYPAQQTGSEDQWSQDCQWWFIVSELQQTVFSITLEYQETSRVTTLLGLNCWRIRDTWTALEQREATAGYSGKSPPPPLQTHSSSTRTRDQTLLQWLGQEDQTLSAVLSSSSFLIWVQMAPPRFLMTQEPLPIKLRCAAATSESRVKQSVSLWSVSFIF